MTDPNDAIGAITNLEQDLRDLGWRPVEMEEPNTGVPFTRWFPPAKPRLDREFIADNMDFPPHSEKGHHPLGEDY